VQARSAVPEVASWRARPRALALSGRDVTASCACLCSAPLCALEAGSNTGGWGFGVEVLAKGLPAAAPMPREAAAAPATPPKRTPGRSLSPCYVVAEEEVLQRHGALTRRRSSSCSRLSEDPFAADVDGELPCAGVDGVPPLPPAALPRRSSKVSAECRDHATILRMRKLLRDRGWLEADELFTDEYLRSSLQATKNGKRRTFEYCAEKLQQSLTWRRECGAARITRLDVSSALAPGHMWWEGADVHGRPILYARPGAMHLSTYRREQYVKMHIYLIEQVRVSRVRSPSLARPRLHYCLLTPCPVPTDPVGQSWPRNTGSVGGSCAKDRLHSMAACVLSHTNQPHTHSPVLSFCLGAAGDPEHGRGCK
jgi:hypothetical protein